MFLCCFGPFLLLHSSLLTFSHRRTAILIFTLIGCYSLWEENREIFVSIHLCTTNNLDVLCFLPTCALIDVITLNIKEKWKVKSEYNLNIFVGFPKSYFRLSAGIVVLSLLWSAHCCLTGSVFCRPKVLIIITGMLLWNMNLYHSYGERQNRLRLSKTGLFSRTLYLYYQTIAYHPSAQRLEGPL